MPILNKNTNNINSKYIKLNVEPKNGVMHSGGKHKHPPLVFKKLTLSTEDKLIFANTINARNLIYKVLSLLIGFLLLALMLLNTLLNSSNFLPKNLLQVPDAAGGENSEPLLNEPLTSAPPLLVSGPDGKSAYDIWREQGNAGSPEDFLNSLVGRAGINGEAGKDGAVGQPGERGMPGKDGVATVKEIPAAVEEPIENLFPSIDNVYSVGSADFRWRSLSLGSQGLYMEDAQTSEQSHLTISNDQLLLNNISLFSEWNVRLSDEGIYAVDGNSDIKIGKDGDTGYLAPSTGIRYPDGTIQTTANVYNSPLLEVSQPLADGAGEETIDLSKEIFVLSEGTWTLPNGEEGRILYFVINSEADAKNVKLLVNNLLRIHHNQSNLDTNVLVAPFTGNGNASASAKVSAIFVNDGWYFSGGVID